MTKNQPITMLLLLSENLGILQCLLLFCNHIVIISSLAPVDQRVLSTDHWINLCPLDYSIGLSETFPINGEISAGKTLLHF